MAEQGNVLAGDRRPGPVVGGRRGQATVPSPPQTTWVFAEGAAAPNFESFYLLLNPNQTPITVTARFLPETGMPTVKNIVVAPRSRFDRLPERRARQHRRRRVDVHVRFAAFLAERSIYWGAGRVEGTNVIGASSAASEWHFPEGASSSLFDTYLLVANPGADDQTVRLTLFIEGVGRTRRPRPELLKTVRAGSRLTIYMNEFLSALETAEGRAVGSLRGRSFSTKIEVLDGGNPVVAEEALYWSSGWRQLLAQRVCCVRHPSVAHAAAAPAGVAAVARRRPGPCNQFPHTASAAATDRQTGPPPHWPAMHLQE